MSEKDKKKNLQNFILPPNICKDMKVAVVTNPTKTFQYKVETFSLNVRKLQEKSKFSQKLILSPVNPKDM